MEHIIASGPIDSHAADYVYLANDHMRLELSFYKLVYGMVSTIFFENVESLHNGLSGAPTTLLGPTLRLTSTVVKHYSPHQENDNFTIVAEVVMGRPEGYTFQDAHFFRYGPSVRTVASVQFFRNEVGNQVYSQKIFEAVFANLPRATSFKLRTFCHTLADYISRNDL
jgi:hypothetical protein